MLTVLLAKASRSGTSKYDVDPSIVLVAVLAIVVLGVVWWFKQRLATRSVGLRCPSCGNHRVRRSRTRGWGEQVAKALQFRPFRCRDCDRRFWAFMKE